MHVQQRLFISTHPDCDEAPSPAFVEQIRNAGGEILGWAHERLIVSASPESADRVEAAMRETELFRVVNLRTYDLPEPSGIALIVNLLYHDGDQLSSATVDERLWAVMTSSSHDCAEADAFVALYENVEIDLHHAPDTTFLIQDVMTEVRLWPGPDALKWDPVMWREDEEKVEITFTALANLPWQRGVVEVAIPGTQSATHTFQVPARLVLEGFPEEEVLNSLAVPAGVRAWVKVGPYSVDHDITDLAPATP